MTKTPKVTGAGKRFDDGRIVFLGRHADHPGDWCVGFRSKEGCILKFRLSEEALAALQDLALNYPANSFEPFPPDLERTTQTMVWRQVDA